MRDQPTASVDNSGACFHCGLPNPPGNAYTTAVFGVPRAFCCPGCVAVADLIAQSGLGEYYRYRDRPGARPGPEMAAQVNDLLRYDQPALQKTFVRDDGTGLRRVTLALRGMRCAACVWLIERHLRRQCGVVDVAVNLANEHADLCWRDADTTLSALLVSVAQLGYAAQPYRPDWQEAARRAEYRAALRRLALAGIGAMQVMMYAVGLYAGAIQGMEEAHRDFLRIVSALVTTPIVVYSARPFFAAAWRDLRNRRLGMDVPVSLAIAVAYGASLAAIVLHTGEVYFDSVCMFVFLLSLGRFLEMRARHRAGAAVDAALRRAPETATRLGAGGQEVVTPYELAAGERVLVKPGETVPADGRVVDGCGWVNESMLTGEHWPRSKAPGDAVVGGTQNGESPLVVAVERVGADTVLAGIVRLMDRAASDKPPIARLADRVAQVFVPSVLLLAAFVAVAWWRIDPQQAFWVTLSVLVVSCPCALSLATPAALTAATGGMLRRGLLVTRAHVLEGLNRVTHVVFDKTGTLTEGRFRLARVVPVGAVDPKQGLAIARALESHSEHPIARAFRAENAGPEVTASGVTAAAGLGVAGNVGGRAYRLGGAPWVAELAGSTPPAPAPDGDDIRILLGDAAGPVCWFALEDTLRPEAAAAVLRLRVLGFAVEVLSGDAPAAVRSVADVLGIGRFVAGATPATKLAHVRSLQADGAVVLMVGDGINDAPVLGAAQVSMAMSGGTDLAKVRADAVLLKEDLGAIVEALQLARSARRVMLQNLTWAAVYNAIALPLAALGLVTPYWAALGMSISSLLVVLNAVRLGRLPAGCKGRATRAAVRTGPPALLTRAAAGSPTA